MTKTTYFLAVLCLMILSSQSTIWAQHKTTSTSARILWYADWETGLKEATRTRKPILLLSAAPHCRNVSGMW